ncbi:MAG TPA: hypothetical protein DCM49_00950 [Lachnospiraceae bacterium]|nr:hypothetical protein [Lachnospiraceae bacterium]
MISFNNADKMEKDIAMSFMNIARGKNYRKISVAEIMAPLSATRQAFYYYFENIDELINWINIQALEIPFTIFFETKNLAQSYEAALKLYIDNSDFFRNVISYMGKGPFEKSMYDQFLKGMIEHIGIRRFSEDEIFAACIYLKGVVDYYLNIIEGNTECDPPKVSEQMCKALPQNLIKYYDYEHFEVYPKNGRFR